MAKTHTKFILGQVCAHRLLQSERKKDEVLLRSKQKMPVVTFKLLLWWKVQIAAIKWAFDPKIIKTSLKSVGLPALKKNQLSLFKQRRQWRDLRQHMSGQTRACRQGNFLGSTQGMGCWVCSCWAKPIKAHGSSNEWGWGGRSSTKGLECKEKWCWMMDWNTGTENASMASERPFWFGNKHTNKQATNSAPPPQPREYCWTVTHYSTGAVLSKLDPV